ncbi:MAG: histidine kinase, partial [Bacteroidota bacterium]
MAPILVLLAIFLILYAYNDPFKVLRPYADYSYSSVFTNRDFVSTSMFIKQFPKNKYNSFIFGSSRTMAYRPEVWDRYLDNDSRVFVFDAAGESVYGIYHKLKYLDAEG